MALYQLNRTVDPKGRWLYEILGLLAILVVWILVTLGENPILQKGILPSPYSVLAAGGEMIRENNLFSNFFYSLGLNLSGYIEAILVALPLGFLLGLIPQVRAAFQRPVDSTRFLVLPAAVGLFIAWFGIGTDMKVHFLAFGIIIYLLPVTVQRIDEVEDIYLRTVYTLGASKWQMIKTVYFPSVIARLFSDIRILTAISWTYIVIAESIGGGAGIGALTWQVGLRRGRVDKVFFLLILIMVVGIIQDKIFGQLDKKFFAFKYQNDRRGDAVAQKSLWKTIKGFTMTAIFWSVMLVYGLLFLDEFVSIFGRLRVLSSLFLDTVWVAHLIFFMTLVFALYEKRSLWGRWFNRGNPQLS